ncbi:MAG: hypothetical protein WCT26_04050 [Candidatus Buchananbacteria bacterium]|jgi:hypothetical protein
MNFNILVWRIIKFVVLICVAILLSLFGIFVFLPLADIILVGSTPYFFGFGDLVGGFVGILMSFGFCFSLIATIAISRYKYYFLLSILILNVLPIYLVYGNGTDLFSMENLKIVIIITVTNIAGWLIGEGILLGWKKIKGGK